MGTRSQIIVERLDGKWSSVYCHWDGCISNNGVILHENYKTQEQAEALVAPGDMSSLGEKCDKPEGHSYARPIKGHTVYYGRDRGEEGTEATIGDTLEEVWPYDSGVEFVYVWRPNMEWYVGDPDKGPSTLVKLIDAIEADKRGENLIKSAVKAFGGNFKVGQRT